MAKKSKTDAVAPAKILKAKMGAKSPAKARKSAPRKKAAIEKIQARPMPIPRIGFDPTDDQISMRAYFISERRRRLDLPGDANSDWLEAKRQLLAEVRH